MPTYQYVDKNGNSATTEAATPEAALSSISSLSPQSGVRPIVAPGVQSTPTNTQVQTPPGTNAAPAVGSVAYDIAKGLPIGTSSSFNVSNSNGPTSSADYITSQNIDKSINSAINPDSGKTPLSDLQKRVMSTYGFDENYVRTLNPADQAQFALALRNEDIQSKQADQAKADQQKIYDASLAQQNEQYSQASQDLSYQKEKDLAAFKATAASLNPYSGASTAQVGYSQAIDHQYTMLQAKIDSQARMAKAALDAGNMEAYAKINNDIASIKEKGIQDIQTMIGNIQTRNTQQQQFQLQMSKYDQATQQTGFTNFMNLVKTMGNDDTLRNAASDFITTGKASETLKPFLEQAQKAGLSPSEAASVVINGTDAAKKQQFYEQIQSEKLVQAQERIAYAQMNSQRDMQVAQNVASVSQALLGKGITPDTPEYALGIASATAGSKTFPSSVDIKDIQGSINMLTQLNSVKSDINTIMDDNRVKNFILTKAGSSVQSILDSKDLAVITGKINSLAPAIAKNLNGQVGSLSDRDIAAALSTLPSGANPADINTALFNSVMTAAKNNLVSKTAAYSAANKNMSGYVPQIKYALDNAKDISSAPVGSSDDIFNNIMKTLK